MWCVAVHGAGMELWGLVVAADKRQCGMQAMKRLPRLRARRLRLLFEDKYGVGIVRMQKAALRIQRVAFLYKLVRWCKWPSNACFFAHVLTVAH